MTHLYIRCARCVCVRSSPQTCMKAAVVLPATQTSMRGQSHTKSGTGDAFNFWFSSVFHKSGPKEGNSLGRHHLSLYTIFFPGSPYRSFHINSELPAVDVNMSIPGQPSIAHVGTCALLSAAHIFKTSHSSPKK